MTIKIKIATKSIAISALFFITSCSKTPVPCFIVDKGKTAKVNEEVQFNAACSADATNFAWDFGDGTTGSGVSTKHKYSAAANYSVKLTASNSKKTVVKAEDITILP